MRHILLRGAAAFAMLTAPALAQQEPQDEAVDSAPAQEWVAQSNSGSTVEPPAQADNPSTVEASGNLTVRGVTPAEALGAVDPAKLTASADADDSVARAASADGSEEAPTVARNEAEGASQDVPANVAEATSVETLSESGSMVQVADVSVPLPVEVAEAVEDGSYSTDDLVAAQLAAIMGAAQQTAEVEPQPGKQPVIPPG